MGTEGGLDCLQRIGLSAFELDIQAEKELILPEYKGSTLRGAFGHAFRRVACPLKEQPCPTCLLGPKCAYFIIFEPPPPPDARRLRKYSTVPHSFVLVPPLEPKRVYAPGEQLSFGLRLVGRAADYLPYFHCGLDPGGWDFRGWIARAEAVGLGRRELRWHDWERYSARQNTWMKLGGFVGEIAFVGDVEFFMSLIRLGEWVHAGKGTSFGLGRYEVVG